MNYWLILIPLFTAFTGWFVTWLLIRILFRNVLPKRWSRITEFAVSQVNDQLLSLDGIEEKISDPKNLEKIMPMIESHIDLFLRERLGKEIPMINMFIGDKTINKLKTALMNEIESLFPKVMKEYATNLRSDLELENIVRKKINEFSPQKLEQLFRLHLSKELRMAGIAGALIGLIIGGLELLVILLVS